MKGFSLIEIMFSLAIIGILTAIVVNSYQISQLKKQQDGIIQSIIVTLEKAQADTQAGKDGSQYGVKFNTLEFIRFTGTSFISNNPSNQINIISPQFVLSNTIVNAEDIIYFSKLYGNPNESATITVSHIDNRIPARSFIIENTGVISVI